MIVLFGAIRFVHERKVGDMTEAFVSKTDQQR